jgi:hypothetical protein
MFADIREAPTKRLINDAMRKHPQCHPIEAITLEVDSEIAAAREALTINPKEVMVLDKIESLLRAKDEVYARYNGLGEEVKPEKLPVKAS